VLVWNALPDPFFIEWFSAAILIGFGGFLFLVPEAFQQQIYSVLNMILPRGVWILALWSFGGFQIAAIYSNRKLQRMAAALVSGVTWSILTVGLYQADRKLPGIVVYAGYVAMNLLTMALLSRRIT